ncbi:hypothetical protein ADEAN_000567700 [Angomonas deanei]|uniref:Uncharacterized protein n=1 Tax=Angomonas deanei TaxID=59799 RepID=A0A7G2CEA6_9TRYP|nr:hypothetical protein ADEAN_000567700 [Angomonas deanei]
MVSDATDISLCFHVPSLNTSTTYHNNNNNMNTEALNTSQQEGAYNIFGYFGGAYDTMLDPKNIAPNNEQNNNPNRNSTEEQFLLTPTTMNKVLSTVLQETPAPALPGFVHDATEEEVQREMHHMHLNENPPNDKEGQPPQPQFTVEGCDEEKEGEEAYFHYCNTNNIAMDKNAFHQENISVIIEEDEDSEDEEELRKLIINNNKNSPHHDEENENNNNNSEDVTASTRTIPQTNGKFQLRTVTTTMNTYNTNHHNNEEEGETTTTADPMINNYYFNKKKRNFPPPVKAAAGSLIAVGGRRVPVTKLFLLSTEDSPYKVNPDVAESRKTKREEEMPTKPTRDVLRNITNISNNNNNEIRKTVTVVSPPTGEAPSFPKNTRLTENNNNNDIKVIIGNNNNNNTASAFPHLAHSASEPSGRRRVTGAVNTRIVGETHTNNNNNTNHNAALRDDMRVDEQHLIPPAFQEIIDRSVRKQQQNQKQNVVAPSPYIFHTDPNFLSRRDNLDRYLLGVFQLRCGLTVQAIINPDRALLDYLQVPWHSSYHLEEPQPVVPRQQYTLQLLDGRSPLEGQACRDLGWCTTVLSKGALRQAPLTTNFPAVVLPVHTKNPSRLVTMLESKEQILAGQVAEVFQRLQVETNQLVIRLTADEAVCVVRCVLTPARRQRTRPKLAPARLAELVSALEATLPVKPFLNFCE